MKFKKLVLISTSTVVAGSSLIALAAACHDENQKKPGNNKQTNLQNKNNQTSQKQEVNPELSQKQTNKSNPKEKNQNPTLSPTIKQPKTSQSQKKQLPQKNYQENENKNSDQKSQESNKKQKDEKLTPTPNIQQKQMQPEQKQQGQIDKTPENAKKEPERKQEGQIDNKKTEEDKVEQEQKPKQPEVIESSDVNFVTNNPIINQEVDYTSYLDLMIDNKFLTSSSNKTFKIVLKPVEESNTKKVEGFGYYSSKNPTNNKNTINFHLNNLDPETTYLLESVTISDSSPEPKESAKETNLKLSTKIKNTKILVKHKKYNVELTDEEKKKNPVTVTAQIMKENSDNSKYKVELSFSSNLNSEINNKYATIVFTFASSYNGLSTINGLETMNYKIQNNKITIPIDSKYIKPDQEIQLQLQRITDDKGSYIGSEKFRLNFEDSNSEFSRNKTQFFKFKLNDAK